MDDVCVLIIFSPSFVEANRSNRGGQREERVVKLRDGTEDRRRAVGKTELGNLGLWWHDIQIHFEVLRSERGHSERGRCLDGRRNWDGEGHGGSGFRNRFLGWFTKKESKSTDVGFRLLQTSCESIKTFREVDSLHDIHSNDHFSELVNELTSFLARELFAFGKTDLVEKTGRNVIRNSRVILMNLGVTTGTRVTDRTGKRGLGFGGVPNVGKAAELREKRVAKT